MAVFAPLRFCSEPNCGGKVRAGRCVAHAKHARAEQWANRPAYHALYNSKRWRLGSRRFLAHYPFCGDRPNGLTPVMSQCRALGLQRLAEQTDHVVPHKGNLGLFFDFDGNCQALCAECGARKSAAGL